jgi:Ca-activated chloride channel family protein
MTFLWAGMLWLLVLLPLLVGIYVVLQRRRKKYALRYASLSLVKDALGPGPGFRRHIPPLLFLIGVATMLVALARPAATINLPSQEGTIVLTMDVSRSMQANDIQPSRLDAAKAAAKTFVDKQPKNVRIGVVSFSDTASIVQSPTTDRAEVLAAIDRLTPQRGTAIGEGILTALAAITGQPVPTFSPFPDSSAGMPQTTPAITPVAPGNDTSAAVILLSDGQSNIGPAPLDIIDQAANQGIKVYTVGIGSTQGTILRYGGRAARVQLDENTLKGIAQATGARYFQADNAEDLRSIYSTLGTQLIFKPQQTELTAWFTGFAMLVMLTAGAISMLWFHHLP